MVATEDHYRKLAEGALRLATLSSPEAAKRLHVLAAEYLEKADALSQSGVVNSSSKSSRRKRCPKSTR
jgi:hypothetical protein